MNIQDAIGLSYQRHKLPSPKHMLNPKRLLHHIVLKKYRFHNVLSLDSVPRRSVLCATGGEKWLKVGLPEYLETIR